MEPALGCPEPGGTKSQLPERFPRGRAGGSLRTPRYAAKEPSPAQRAPTDTHALPRHPPWPLATRGCIAPMGEAPWALPSSRLAQAILRQDPQVGIFGVRHQPDQA